MAQRIEADRILETATTTGTGDFTLAGAVTGFRRFNAVCSTGDTVRYLIEAVDGSNVPTGDWEVGYGTYSASNTLTRTLVLASSNAGAAVSFSAGTKLVALLDLAAAKGRVVLASDVTNNNGTANTIADVTGLSFAVKSGRTYRFRFQIVYTTAATTTGSRWSVSGPASPTSLAYRSEYSLTTTTRTTNEGQTAYDAPAASNASGAVTGAGNIAIVEGIIKPSADGTLIARFASEIASSAVVAKAGLSFVDWELIA
jgi:hypothetical protein